MYISKQFLWVFVLLFFPITAVAQTQTEDTTIQHLLFSHTNAWTMHNPEAIDNVFNKDAVYEDVAYGAVMHGRDEIKTLLRETFEEIPDFEVKIVSWFSCGNKLSCEWVMSGTLTKDTTDTQAAGKPFSVRGTSVATIKDGKFERWTDYYDK